MIGITVSIGNEKYNFVINLGCWLAFHWFNTILIYFYFQVYHKLLIYFPERDIFIIRMSLVAK